MTERTKSLLCGLLIAAAVLAAAYAGYKYWDPYGPRIEPSGPRGVPLHPPVVMDVPGWNGPEITCTWVGTDPDIVFVGAADDIDSVWGETCAGTARYYARIYDAQNAR